MGAPIKKAFTKRDYDKIEKLVSEGYTRQSIAAEFGMSSATFYRWIDKDEKLKESLAVGKAQDFQLIMNTARKKAIEGSYQHMAGYMRVIHNVDMSDPSANQKSGNQIVINLNLGASDQGQIIDHNLEDVVSTIENNNNNNKLDNT